MNFNSNKNKIKFSTCFPFELPRAGQQELIEKIITAFQNGKKHVILQAPTGIGKSVIAYTVANYFYLLNCSNKKTIQKQSIILTSQKCLQEQYYHDLNIPLIFGRNNYKCLMNPALTCEEGYCKGKFKCNNCNYKNARLRIMKSKLSSMNYAFFLNMIKNPVNNKDYELLVFDECHNAEQELLQMCSIEINKKILEYLGCTYNIFPSVGCSDEYLVNWLKDIVCQIKVELSKEYAIIDKLDIITKGNKNLVVYKKRMSRFRHLQKYAQKINDILEQYKNGNKLITTINSVTESISFKMLHGSNLFNNFISKLSNKFLHMSATVLSKEEYCKSLGISEQETEYISCDAIFPVENRLIYYDPIGKMSYNEKQITIPKLVKRVDAILNQYSNDKGIIHSISYELTEAIISGITEKNRWRLLIPRPNNRQEILNYFYNSSEPYVLLSPSLTEGLDLKDDLSRFCIVCKIPYANTSDKWTKERMNEDNKWYNTNTCSILMQMTGRSVRSENDKATTYILDKCFEQLVQKSGYLFPQWWQESIMTIDDEKTINSLN